MDPLSAGLIGGTSLLGGVLNYFGQKSANANALRNMREQNAFTRSMWDATNAYNTPLAQRRRYEEAGINPYLALGNIQAGNAQGVTAPAPAGVENPMAGLGNAVAGTGNAIVQSYMQSKLIDAQAENQLAQADLARRSAPFVADKEQSQISVNQSTADRNRSQINVDKSTTDLQKAQTAMATMSAERMKLLTPYEKELMIANTEATTASTEFTKLQTKIQSWEFENLAPLKLQQMKVEIQQSLAFIGNLVANSRVAYAQAELLGKQAITEIAKAYGIQRHNAYIDKEFQMTYADFLARMDKNRADIGLIDASASKTRQDNSRAWLGLALDFGKTAISAVSGIPMLGSSAPPTPTFNPPTGHVAPTTSRPRFSAPSYSR